MPGESSKNGESDKPKPKDCWDKADVVLKPVGGLLTALAVALFTFWSTCALKERDRLARDEALVREEIDRKTQLDREESDRKARLYSELMSRREESESTLRSQMFSKIIDSFIEPGKVRADERVLNLELLVHNFHESLNLAPLFLHLEREIRTSKGLSPGERQNLSRRLRGLALEVSRKQLQALSAHGAGQRFEFTFELKGNGGEGAGRILSVAPIGVPSGDADGRKVKNGDPLHIGQATLNLEEIERKVQLFVEDVSPGTEQVRVRIEIDDTLLAQRKPPVFWLSYFDFPMINNTRLSSGHRLAVILEDFDTAPSSSKGQTVTGAASISVITFPEAYASLKDRPFFQDILEDLQGQNAGEEAAGDAPER